jgi:large subunit ribosomal protein L24
VDIKKGDTVEIITGKDRGKRGLVLRTQPKESRVVVEGINVRKKHTSQNKQTGSGRTMQGGTVEFPGPMHVSNVMLVCPKCSETTRVRHSAGSEHGGRVCPSCGASIDAR